MKIDFTLDIYKLILETFSNKAYQFQTFEEFILNPKDRVVILRHDVDRLPENALKTAIIENHLDVKSCYYFRILKNSNKPSIISEIANLGHEIGYHYEDLSLSKNNKQLAINNFSKNLEYFRTFYPVKTICMHGSPLSKWDNRSLWEDYNYKDYGIIGEPYFDVDFNKVYYITDTGRKWNDLRTIVRDKVNTKFEFKIRNSHILIEMIRENKLPDIILFNTHPQRWSNFSINWLSELFLQNLKNVIKRFIN